MCDKNQECVFLLYATSLIKYKVRQLIKKPEFSASDQEDLEQMFLLELFQRLPKYDARRGKMNTFIARVIDKRIASLIEKQNVGKRDPRKCIGSLNDPWVDDEGRSIERGETINREEVLLRTGALSRPSEDLLGLPSEIKTVLESQPMELRNLCLRLQTASVSEISEDTGVKRGIIYDRMKKLRKVFKEAGLEEYLR